MFRPKETMLVFLVVGLMVSGPVVHSQEAALSEREAMYYHPTTFRSWLRGGSIQPHWMSDGSSFWYAEGAPNDAIIYIVDPSANTKVPLFDSERLRDALTPLLGHEAPYEGLPFREFTFVDEGETDVRFTVDDKDFILRLDTYKITHTSPLSDAEKNRPGELPSPDRRWFASIKDHNLWLRSSNDSRSVPLTRDGVREYEWAASSDGWWRGPAMWSPDGFKLALMRTDYREVPQIPIVHWLKTTEEVEWVPYTKAGQPMPQTELFVVDVNSNHKVRIDTGHEPDQQIFVLAWLSDGSELLFVRADRYVKKLDLIAANPATGATRIVLTETRDTFIQLWRQWDKFLTLCGDGKRFIWLSERDGWKHLYLYELGGALIRRLTEGAFPVIQVVAVDEKGGWVYFTAHGDRERPYDTHLYRVDLQGEGLTRLTDAAGQHNIQFAPSKGFYVDIHSSLNRPPAAELRRADGTLLQTLTKANVDALAGLPWSPPEEVVVKALDEQTDIYGVLYKPFDFEPTRKYPVIEIILAGPYSNLVPRTFTNATGVFAQGLAHFGFIVLMLDGRGTPGRGREFREVYYGNIGRQEIPEHASALQQLARRRHYMDLRRVGVFGVSFGGYMAIRGMLLAPDVYHVGVASYPITDMAGHTGNERLLGPPEENADGYEYASNLRFAVNLKGKLLLLHGTGDTAVPFSHTMKMVEALTKAGKPYDLIVIPEQGHVFTGAARAYAREAVLRYFQEHLKP